jgi:multidrug efflux pump subunit AcrA (membrane-fusion protein)
VAPFNLSNGCWLQDNSTAACFVSAYINDEGVFVKKESRTKPISNAAGIGCPYREKFQELFKAIDVLEIVINRTSKQGKMMAYNKNKSRISQNIAGFIRTRWMMILVIVIMAAGTAFGFNFWIKINTNQTDEKVSFFTVRRDDLIVTVTETGNIKPSSTIDIECQVEAGRNDGVRIISIVPEGTYITQEDVDNGEVLVKLDDSAFTEELTQREMDFASAAASLAQARESKNIQVKQNDSDVTAARLAVKWALMDLRKYLGEDNADRVIKDANEGLVLTGDYLESLLDNMDPLEICSIGQRLKEINNSTIETDQNLKLAQNRLDGTRKLREAEYVSALELQQDELSVKTLRLRKKQNELSLHLFTHYDFPKEVQTLLSDYNESERKLERTYAIARSKLSQSEAELKNSESRHESRKERLEETRKQIELCTIKATSPGLVVYGGSEDDDHGRRRRGKGIIAEGEMVYEHQKIITMPDTADMIAEIFIHESSVAKVRPGQRARITVDTFSDKTFYGKVLKVAAMPNGRRWFNPDLKVYTAKVSIEGIHEYLKPGMSANVEILVEQLENVVIAPIQTVANQAGKKVSYRLTSQGIERTEVETGSFNDDYVHIIDGLDTGDKILLSPPRITETTHLGEDRYTASKIQFSPVENKSFEKL